MRRPPDTGNHILEVFFHLSHGLVSTKPHLSQTIHPRPPSAERWNWQPVRCGTEPLAAPVARQFAPARGSAHVPGPSVTSVPESAWGSGKGPSSTTHFFSAPTSSYLHPAR